MHGGLRIRINPLLQSLLTCNISNQNFKMCQSSEYNMKYVLSYDLWTVCVFKTRERPGSRLTQEYGNYQMGTPYCFMLFSNFGFILHEVRTKFTFGDNFRRNKESSDN